MSEQQTEYNYKGKDQKTQPVSLTLNNEQVREVIQYAAQTSPELIVAEALKVLENHPDMVTPDLLNERDAQIILRTIATIYHN